LLRLLIPFSGFTLATIFIKVISVVAYMENIPTSPNTIWTNLESLPIPSAFQGVDSIDRKI